MVSKGISQKLHLKLKQLYPEGRSLDKDREHDANTIYDSSSPAQIEQWAKNKSRSDLKGYDTTDAKEPPVGKVLKGISGGDSGKDAIQDEPDRFLDERQVTGKLALKHKERITDFESFVKAVEGGWRSDKSLRNLVDSMKGNTDAYQNMFRTDKIQDIIDKNTRPVMVNYIMKKFGVEPVRASRVVQMLPINSRSKLYKKAKYTSLPKIKLSRQTKVLKKIRWSEQELNIIRKNKNLSKDKLYQIFIRNTPNKRSLASVIQKQMQFKKTNVRKVIKNDGGW